MASLYPFGHNKKQRQIMFGNTAQVPNAEANQGLNAFSLLLQHQATNAIPIVNTVEKTTSTSQSLLPQHLQQTDEQQPSTEEGLNAQEEEEDGDNNMDEGTLADQDKEEDVPSNQEGQDVAEEA
jgi:hypothetical protein